MGIKWNDVRVGVSPITNSIFIGKTKKEKNHEIWTDRSEDKTDDVVIAVMDYLLNKDGHKASFNSGVKLYEIKLTVTDVEVAE